VNTSHSMRTVGPLARHLATLAATVLAVAACGSGAGRGEISTAPIANTPPVILNLGDLAANQDTAVGPVSFNVGDGESNPLDLRVSVASADQTLIANDGIALSGASGERKLTLTPNEAATGTTVLHVTVVDPQGLSTTKAINVALRAVNASVRTATTGTFAKAEAEQPTTVNGLTFQQDADELGAFDALIANSLGE
jgi:hypothetical protein